MLPRQKRRNPKGSVLRCPILRMLRRSLMPAQMLAGAGLHGEVLLSEKRFGGGGSSCRGT